MPPMAPEERVVLEVMSGLLGDVGAAVLSIVVVGKDVLVGIADVVVG